MRDRAATADPLAEFSPPYELTSDMLFVMALAPTAPLRRAFPEVGFLSLLGKTPLLLWFSRITEICYGNAAGERHREGDAQTAIYHELNVLAVLRQRAVFVPGIYATSERSIQIARRYGMPKEARTISFEVRGACIASVAADGARRSFVHATLFAFGEQLGRIPSVLWPLRTWPVRFPSGSQVQAVIQASPAVHLARVRGRLSLEEPWLPKAVPFVPVGVYIRGLRMELPPP